VKSRQIVFSPEAQDDLIALYDWIADAASPPIAMAYINPIEAFCVSLSTASERGRARDDIRPGLRIIGFEKRLTVAFLVTEKRVTLLRLFYGGQDWEGVLAEED